MAKVAITEQYLEDIADAIREKTGMSTVTYLPSEMAPAIMTISGGGGITPTGTINITQNGTHNVTTYASASVSVPNTYTLSDEGKVVYGGDLVSQTSTTYTTNNTYDTTLINRVTVDVPTGGEINNQDKTVNPSTSEQEITADSGYTGLGVVTVTAMPNLTLPTSTAAAATSGYTSKATISRSTSDQYINISTGYNAAGAYYKINAVANGTAGTPTASKGTVSNHSISVTPSVTNTTGYITGSTISGTAVTVSASELVSGTKSITANGTAIDVTNYAAVDVAVPTGGDPTIDSLTVTPTESEQTFNSSSVDGYKPVTVGAISSTYVGSGIDRRSSTDLTASGATVSVPAGYYSAAASKSVASGSATGPSSISASSATITTGTNTITLTKTSVSTTPTVSAGYVSSATASTATVALTASVTVNPTPTASGATVTIPAGYYSAQTTKSVTSGSATAPSTISGTAASVSTGTNTLTLTKTVSVTPIVSAGYVSAGTAGNASVSLTASVTTKAAATITPGTTNQTIASGTYLTGTQTIAGDVDLVASNIKKDVNIFGVTGTYEPNDFVITLTQDSNENWVPDCTYAEAYAAYQAGKNIIFSTRGTEPTLGSYSTDEGVFLYSIFEFYQNGFNDYGYTNHDYRWTSSGTESDGTSTYRDTTFTTATISDVVSGQTFFNSSGYQTGTLVVQNYYTGSSAPSSSLGSNGDLYLQS